MSHDRTTIVFAGGGTGGHLFPGIAVASALQSRVVGSRSVFVGSEREIEPQIVGDHGFEHRPLPVGSSSLLWKHPLRFLNQMRRSVAAARQILNELDASLVVGLGGYASVPIVCAAKSQHIPVLLLEQNAVPGRATSWLARQSQLTCLGFSESRTRLPKGVASLATGNPLRSEIVSLAKTVPAADDRRSLLVLGGSQGSSALNEAFLASVKRSPRPFADWRIVHQTGPRDADRVRNRYESLKVDALVAPFFLDLAEHYRRAGMAVCRAGALTLSELACAGIPAVVLPYPNAVRNHQWRNACAFEHVGAVRIVRQSRMEERTADDLSNQLSLLLADRELRSRMARAIRSRAKPDAANLVAERITQLLDQTRPPASIAPREAAS